MAAPTHYGIEYEINPWMDRTRQADRIAATAQWEGLHRVLTEQLGLEVCLVEPVPGCPDLVFTANAGVVLDDRVVLSRFRHPERQGEEPHFAAWFAAHGFQVLRIPDEVAFEGEGDALFVGDTLIAGYLYRSEVAGHRRVGELLGVRVLSVELTDPRFYHLDTCFCPLSAETALYFPPAFDAYAHRVLAANVARLIPVEEPEAIRFACNAVVYERSVALNTGCPRLEEQLRELGYTPYSTPLDEFLKAGGSAKCLTLHLDRRIPTCLDAGGPATP